SQLNELAPASSAASRQVAKGRDDILVHLPLEWDDEVRQSFQFGPAPVAELRLHAAVTGPVDVDLALIAPETEGDPFLPLAAISSAPRHPDQVSGKIIGQPAVCLGQKLGRDDVRFLVQFAEGGCQRLLAGVDAALRHLPPCPSALCIARSIN